MVLRSFFIDRKHFVELHSSNIFFLMTTNEIYRQISPSRRPSILASCKYANNLYYLWLRNYAMQTIELDVKHVKHESLCLTLHQCQKSVSKFNKVGYSTNIGYYIHPDLQILNIHVPQSLEPMEVKLYTLWHQDVIRVPLLSVAK